MTEKFICLLIVALVTILILVCLENKNLTQKELFVTKKDKAQSIYTWFMNNTGHESYAEYKQYMKNQSNIVEYEDVLGLAAKGQLTAAAIENII